MLREELTIRQPLAAKPAIELAQKVRFRLPIRGVAFNHTPALERIMVGSSL